MAGPLASRLAADLRRRFALAGLGRGDRLPSIRAIERLAGAGRSVVVDALDQLAREGVLVRRHGRGTFLCEAPPLAAAGAERLLLLACGLRADHPYLARLLDGLGAAADAQGCTLPVACLPAGGAGLAAAVAARRPAGLVLCGEVGPRALAAAARTGLPLVVAAGVAAPALRLGAAWVGHDDRE
ncbi:MAG: GntR family transcriptional regulator, partial [Planctomycetes bacterium]|nr:GntR family transcriptional regulator [Planctomycetota bacterium]